MRCWMLSYLEGTEKVVGISSYNLAWAPRGHLAS